MSILKHIMQIGKFLIWRACMQTLTVNTLKYDIDITKLLARRLRNAGAKIELMSEGEDKRSVEITVENESDMVLLSEAVYELLLRDISNFELAQFVNELDLSLEEKEIVLAESVKESRSILPSQSVKRELYDYLMNNKSINLEGFLRFRMQDAMKAFQLCVERVSEELALRAEYIELLSILAAFVSLQQPKIKEVCLIFNADGSCTLTDDTDSRIDYDKCNSDGLVSVLIGLAPEKIIIYDLSCGQSDMLADMILRVFTDKVSFFR